LLKLSRYIHLNPVYGKRWKGVPLEAAAEPISAFLARTEP
jgi:hypothetical protein